MVDVVNATRVGGDKATVLVTSASGEQVRARAVVMVGANGVSVASGIGPATNSAGFASSAASTNPTQVKTTPGTLRQVSGYNASGSARYLRFYDTAIAPVAGTTTIRKRIYLPPLTGFVFDYNDAYAVGIAFAITGFNADNDATIIGAGDILALNVDYL